MPLNPPTPASVEAVALALNDPCSIVGRRFSLETLSRWQARAAIAAYQAQGEGGACQHGNQSWNIQGTRGRCADCGKVLSQADFAQPATAGQDGELNARELLAQYYEHPLVDSPSMAKEIRSPNWRAGHSGAEQAFLEILTRALSLPPSPPNEGLREALEEAQSALRWVYESGMQKDRPQFVSDAISDAFAPIRAALKQEVKS